jgi:glutathione synthase/RimK-type ligase-like ATP-grasp enzyme
VPRLTIATCAELPTGDEDGDRLTDAITELGVDWQWAVWTDPAVDWAAAGLVFIRSTWDYTAHREQFLAWAEKLDRVENPAPVLRWNSDKVYLRDLAEGGVPVVPTSYTVPGESVWLPDAEIVVKPSIGAGSKGAGRFDVRQPGVAAAARVHAQALHDAGRVVLVQPYLSEVDHRGETALIYLDGRFSHAIGKAAMLPGDTVNDLDPDLYDALYLSERITPRNPSEEEFAVGEQVLRALRARFGADLLYARVDLLPTPAGPVLIEAELTEPSLFLGFDPGSADRVAAAVARRLR